MLKSSLLAAAPLVVGLTLASGAAPAQAAPGVRIEDAAARLVVIPEARHDVSVTVRQGEGRLPPLRTRTEGDTIVVEGGLRDRIQSCGAINVNIIGLFAHRRGEPSPGQRVMVRGVGLVPYEHLPVVTARVPLDSAVSVSGAVWGEIGATDRLRLAKSGCGDVTVGDVRGDFDLASNGSGDTAMGRSGRLRASLRGSGDLQGGDVGGGVDLSISGSGDARLGRVGGLAVAVKGSGDVRVVELSGALNVSVAGSGDVQVDGGRAPAMSARVLGSGDVKFWGEAGSLSAQIAGSGDIRVAQVSGPVAKSVHGSGDVVVGR